MCFWAMVSTAESSGRSRGARACGVLRVLTRFSDEGSQRYSSIRNQNLQIHFGAALAWELYAPLKLRVGATGMLVQVTVDQRLGLNSAGVFAAPEDPEYDIFADVSAKRSPIFSAMYALSLRSRDSPLLQPFKAGSRFLRMVRWRCRSAKRSQVLHRLREIRLRLAPACLRLRV